MIVIPAVIYYHIIYKDLSNCIIITHEVLSLFLTLPLSPLSAAASFLLLCHKVSQIADLGSVPPNVILFIII